MVFCWCIVIKQWRDTVHQSPCIYCLLPPDQSSVLWRFYTKTSPRRLASVFLLINKQNVQKKVWEKLNLWWMVTRRLQTRRLTLLRTRTLFHWTEQLCWFSARCCSQRSASALQDYMLLFRRCKLFARSREVFLHVWCEDKPVTSQLKSTLNGVWHAVSTMLEKPPFKRAFRPLKVPLKVWPGVGCSDGGWCERALSGM